MYIVAHEKAFKDPLRLRASPLQALRDIAQAFRPDRQRAKGYNDPWEGRVWT
jgi:hypothetical protein